jgi:HPt (histidine-containing phosphotransfer) domain-containing protein
MPESRENSMAEPIISLLADDPDLRDLVEDFVAAMPDRLLAILTAVKSDDLPAVRRCVHQLKGACGGYGFPSLTDEAGKLEKQIELGCSISDLGDGLSSLVRNLSRVSAGPS